MRKNWLKKVLSIALTVAIAGSLTACGNGSGNENASSKTVKNEQQQSGQEETKAVPEVVNIGVQTLITPELVARYEKIMRNI